MGRYAFWGLWIGFVLYALILAPPDRPGTFDLILRLSTGHWEGLNPVVIALFNAMGIWPMVYAGVALIDGHGQRLRAWPFVAASFAVGAFALLPYLALRSPNPTFTGPKSTLLRLVEFRGLGALLGAGAIALLAWAVLQGDWVDFWHQWQSSRFIHIMTLDFIALWGLFPVLLTDDQARRGRSQPWVVGGVLALPLVGACLYLALRPPWRQAPPADGPTDGPADEPLGHAEVAKAEVEF